MNSMPIGRLQGKVAVIFGAGEQPGESVTHHCHIVETGNESHRFLHSTAVAKKRIKACEQAKKVEPF